MHHNEIDDVTLVTLLVSELKALRNSITRIICIISRIISRINSTSHIVFCLFCVGIDWIFINL